MGPIGCPETSTTNNQSTLRNVAEERKSHLHRHSSLMLTIKPTLLCIVLQTNIFSQWRNSLQWVRASSLTRLPDHTQTHTTLGRTPLDVWSARRRDLYLTAHNTHKKQTSTPPTGFEPAIPASERPQTHALDRAATAIGCRRIYACQIDKTICKREKSVFCK
jgi:hypothetical protein